MLATLVPYILDTVHNYKKKGTVYITYVKVHVVIQLALTCNAYPRDEQHSILSFSSVSSLASFSLGLFFERVRRLKAAPSISQMLHVWIIILCCGTSIGPNTATLMHKCGQRLSLRICLGNRWYMFQI